VSENRFFGVLCGILTLALLCLAGHVDWPAVPSAGVTALVVVALAAVALALVALQWAADRELAQPLAHPLA
jgi:hypothetical protein